VLCAVLTSSACFRAPVPMEKIEYPVNPPAKCLVVLMPGAGSDEHDFEKEGFVKVLQDSGLSLDIVAANATLGYYMKETMIPRAHDDVIAPAAAAKPYEKKWIIGMSMGGFGSLFYAEHFPTEIDGVYALAPWLGSRSLTDEIRAAGGLKKWQAPPEAPTNGDNYQQQLWRFLQLAGNDPSKTPAIYVGWGNQDSLGDDDKLFADVLPADHVDHAEGAHEWPVWNTLLARFLKEGPMAKDCAGPGVAPGPATTSIPWSPRRGTWGLQSNSFRAAVLRSSLRPRTDAAPQ
jgi:S-formylglutathione hydrolase FrmB